MGQRHQIFIRIPNPNEAYKKAIRLDDKKRWRDNLEGYRKAQLQYDKYKEALGTDETTVLAFHNQWLYGITALINALQVLTFNKNAGDDGYSNPFHKDFFDKNCYNNRDVEWLIKLTENVMNIRNSELAGKFGRGGVDSSFFLNIEEPYMRHFYDNGDNNDGVTIVDLVEGKYCFASFSGTEGSKNTLPKYVPISARDYVESYYPENPDELGYYGKTNGWDSPDHPLAERQKIAEKFMKQNKSIANKFKKFPLLTLDELKAIFPQVYERLDPKEIGAVPEQRED